MPSSVLFLLGAIGLDVWGSTAKPAGMEEWDVRAWMLRRPRGSLRSSARSKTDPKWGKILSDIQRREN